MKKLICTIVIMLAFACIKLNAQNTFPASGSTGIGTTTPDASAVLDVTSNLKGVLLPHLTSNQRDAIVSPATGLLIYQINNTPGFYYYTGTAWTAVKTTAGAGKTLNNLTAPTKINTELLPDTNNTIDLGASSQAWKDLYLNGDIFKNGGRILSLAGSGNTFLGNTSGFFNSTGTNNTFLGNATGVMNTTGTNNAFIGTNAGASSTTGNNNSFFGSFAGNSNTTGVANSFFGSNAGRLNTTGGNNSFFGTFSGDANTIGANNSFFGEDAGGANTSGNLNSFFGSSAGNSNISGAENSFFGYFAGASNTAGYNSFFGVRAGLANTTGTGNNFFGNNAGTSNSSGSNNTSFGSSSLNNNTTGSNNTCAGNHALNSNTSGANHAAFGDSSLYTNTNGTGNTALGHKAGKTPGSSSFCTYIGFESDNQSGLNLSNANAFGYQSRVTAANTCRIGNSVQASIGGFANWSNVSDGRYKNNVKENVIGLEFIKLLRPVTYTLDVKSLNNFLHVDGDETAVREKEAELQTGFIAQEVESAAQKVGYDFHGVDKPKNEKDLYGLRYAEFTVPLVKAVQELSEEDGKQKSEVRNQKSEIENLKTEIENLKSCIESLCNNSDKQQSSDLRPLTSAILFQNQPNPFSEKTIIRCELNPDFSSAKIIIRNLDGALMMLQNISAKGNNSIEISAKTLSPGTYTYTLEINNISVDTKLMVVTK